MAIKNLKDAVKTLLFQVERRDFVSIFCARYRFEKMPYSPYIREDAAIDLDTDLVYKPVYGTLETDE